jgi:RNA methyltransferase, TrmH family
MDDYEEQPNFEEHNLNEEDRRGQYRPETRGYETKYYGFHACQRLWKERPEDIIRAYIEPGKIKAFATLLKWCAQNKKAYHVVDSEAIAKVTQSTHHEGICLLVKDTPPVTFEDISSELQEMGNQVCLIYLDGVQDPHNIGSIMRICANFNVPYILGDMHKLPKMTPAACRVAKGAAEIVKLVPLKNPTEAIEALKSYGFEFIISDHQSGHSIHEFDFHEKTVLVMGSEMTGISPQIEDIADDSITIPGSGKIESLNVAASTAICLSEYWRCIHSEVVH